MELERHKNDLERLTKNFEEEISKSVSLSETISRLEL